MAVNIDIPFQKVNTDIDFDNIFIDRYYNGNGFAGTPFYGSSYICPSCQTISMHKTVCKIGSEPNFLDRNIPGRRIIAKRMFTCALCNLLVIPEPGYALKDKPYIYVAQFKESKYYWDFIKAISPLCTTDGRGDL